MKKKLRELSKIAQITSMNNKTVTKLINKDVLSIVNIPMWWNGEYIISEFQYF